MLDANRNGVQDTEFAEVVSARLKEATRVAAFRAGLLGFTAVSLAACGGSDDAASDQGGQTPVTPTTPVAGSVVDGTDHNGDALDGNGDTTVELRGNTDPSIDAGEWTDIAVITVRDANGNITITDIQATDNDAASGSPGTTFAVHDYAQNDDGVLSFQFDAQATDGDDTSVTVLLNEVAGAVGFTGGDIETLNAVIASGAGTEPSTMRALAAEGLETLNISGGTSGETFTIQSPLNSSITLLDASTALSDLRLDVSPTPSLDFLLATGGNFEYLGATQLSGASVLLSFDGLDPNGPDSATLEYNPVDRTVILDIDGFDPINLEVPSALADEWTQLPTLLNGNATVISVTGGATGLDVNVGANGGELAVLSALLATPDDVPTAATFLLGEGDDRLAMGDSYSTGDVIDGGAGTDTVSMTIETSAIRTGTMTDVEVLDIFFRQGSTFDGTNVSGLTTINLGVDRNGDPARSLASADFDNLSAEVTTINIHDTSFDLEIDYANNADANLTVNFVNPEFSVIGDAQGTNDLEFHNVRDLTMHSMTDAQMLINQSVDLNGDTRTLTLTTTTEGGDILIEGQSTGFADTASLEEITVYALHGNISVGSVTTTVDRFIGDAEELQVYDVTAEDAFADFGRVGELVEASELEIVSLETFDEGALLQNDIYAFGADIAEFTVTATDRNVIGVNNIAFGGLFADSVNSAVINAADGGNILLDEQNYVAGHFIYQGSGTIEFIAGNNGAVTAVAASQATPFVQTQAFDATSHTGTRIFRDNETSEVFFGSTEADIIQFSRDSTILGPNPSVDVYFDAGGNDTVFNNLHSVIDPLDQLTLYDDGSADLDDTGMATDDDYTLLGYSAVSAQVVFHAGGGDDTVTFHPSLNLVLIDFDDYDSGVVDLQETHSGVQLSFDGLEMANGTLTSNTAVDVNTATTSLSSINDNVTYVLSDGDAPTVGPNSGATIADYENLSDVANYLNALTNFSGSGGDDIVFVINNGTTSSAPGDDHDAYIYAYSDTGSAGIQASELTIISTVDAAIVNPISPILAADIV